MRNELFLAHRSLRQLHDVPTYSPDLRNGHRSLQPDHAAGLLRPVDEVVAFPDAEQVRSHRNPVNLQPEETQQRRFVQPQFAVEIDKTQPCLLHARGEQFGLLEREGIAEPSLCDNDRGAGVEQFGSQGPCGQIVDPEWKPEMLQCHQDGLIHDACIRIAAPAVHQYQQGSVAVALTQGALHHFSR